MRLFLALVLTLPVVLSAPPPALAAPCVNVPAPSCVTAGTSGVPSEWQEAEAGATLLMGTGMEHGAALDCEGGWGERGAWAAVATCDAEADETRSAFGGGVLHYDGYDYFYCAVVIVDANRGGPCAHLQEPHEDGCAYTGVGVYLAPNVQSVRAGPCDGTEGSIAGAHARGTDVILWSAPGTCADGGPGTNVGYRLDDGEPTPVACY